MVFEVTPGLPAKKYFYKNDNYFCCRSFLKTDAMNTQCAATILHVDNVDTSLKYYTEVLGFTLDFQYNNMAGVEYGPVLIYLSGPRQDLKKKIGEGTMYIFCNEVDDYYQQVLTKGAIVLIELEDRQYGMRDFALADPDGNALTFGTEIKNAEKV